MSTISINWSGTDYWFDTETFRLVKGIIPGTFGGSAKGFEESP